MERNVAGVERIASLLLGGLSLSQLLNSNRSTATKTAAGGLGLALLWRGATGSCPLYQTINVSTYSPDNKTTLPQLLERSALVNLPIEEVRSFLEMEDTPYGLFDSGDQDDSFQIDIDSRTWTLQLSPHADRERTLIKLSWTDPVPTSATGVFTNATGISDSLPTPSSAAQPQRMLEIRKLKSLMETGEIATVEGQSHGERSSLGSMLENFGEFILEKVQSRTALPTRLEKTSVVADNADFFPKRRVQA